MKKLYIILLAMLSCVVSAYAQSFAVDGISYNVTSVSPAEVEVTGGEIKEVIEIPETITYDGMVYTVTSIGSRAFSGRSNSSNFTRKYIIPGTVRTIGSSAFYDNYYLEEVEFNEGLQTIGNDAFGFNFQLKEIRIPSTVTSIESQAFRTNQQNRATISCSAETPPAIQSSTFSGRTDATLHVVVFDVEAYREAEYWKDFSEITGDILFTDRCYTPVITNDNGILTMSCMTEGATIYYTTDGSKPDENAIRYTSPISYNTNQIIRAIAIAEGYENSTIRNFYDKEQVENINDEQGVTYILNQDDNRFYYSVMGHSDEMDAEIVIPAFVGDCPVKSIERYAFSNCTSLTSIIIPNSVTSIGNSAFYGCSSLNSVTIPGNVTRIGEKVFSKCDNLNDVKIVVMDYSEFCNNIIVGALNDYIFFAALNKSLYLIDTDGNEIREYIIPEGVTAIEKRAFMSCEGLTTITIPNSVTTINNEAFSGCSSLKSITIPNSVTNIGYSAFSSCSVLTSVTIPNRVTSIAIRTFFRCSSLTSVTIPSSVTSIGNEVFYQCSSLNSVTIPSSVTSIGENAFYDCSRLNNVKIVVMDYSEFCNNNIVGRFYYTIQLLDTDGKEITEYDIPDGVTTIGENSFRNCNGLTSVTIPNNVTTIGDYAFYNCSRLISVEVENPTPVAITQNTFSNRANTTLSVPVGSRSAYLAADYWKEFKKIADMNDAISFADANVKAICVSAWDKNGDGELSYAEAAAVTSIEAVFRDNTLITSFKELQYFKGLIHIDNYAFNGCSSLTSVTIPSSVTSIGKSAFDGCTNLTSVTFPENMTEIGDYSFNGCTSLTSITIPESVTYIGEYNQEIKGVTNVEVITVSA